MKVRLARPTLDAVDSTHSESMCVFVFQDIRPLKGLAGLVDWRVGATLSGLLQSGWYSGADGEDLLMPVKHKLPVDKLFCFGLGPASGFTRESQPGILHRAFAVLREAGVHGTIIAPPGRPEGFAGETSSLETVCAVIDPAWDFDEIVIVDDYRRLPDANRKLELLLKPILSS